MSALKIHNLDAIEKLNDHNYLTWATDMTDQLNILGLLKYTRPDMRTAPMDASAKERIEHATQSFQVVSLMRTRMERRGVKMTNKKVNAAEVWTLIEKAFTKKGSGTLNERYRKLIYISLASYKEDTTAYADAFLDAISNLE